VSNRRRRAPAPRDTFLRRPPDVIPTEAAKHAQRMRMGIPVAATYASGGIHQQRRTAVMAQTQQKISFETVSAIGHPEYYNGDAPSVRPEQVPDEHWHTVERVGEDVHDQYNGLRQLMEQGELIRDVRLLQGESGRR
jgi:hypothetical protein